MSSTPVNTILEVIKILISAITPFVALYTALKVVDRRDYNENRRKTYEYCVDIIEASLLSELTHLNNIQSGFYKYLTDDLKKIPYFIQNDILELKLYFHSNEMVLTNSYAGYMKKYQHEAECHDKYPEKSSIDIYNLETNNYDKIHEEFNKKIEKIIKKITEKKDSIAKKLKFDK